MSIFHFILWKTKVSEIMREIASISVYSYTYTHKGKYFSYPIFNILDVLSIDSFFFLLWDNQRFLIMGCLLPPSISLFCETQQFCNMAIIDHKILDCYFSSLMSVSSTDQINNCLQNSEGFFLPYLPVLSQILLKFKCIS